MTTKAKSIVALLLTVMFWGLAFPAVSDLMASGLTVGTLNIFRFGIAFLSLLPFFAKDLKRLTKKDVYSSILCGVLLFGGFFFVTLALGEEASSPGISALIVGTSIFVTPLLSYLIFKRKLSVLSVLGILVAFTGIFFFGYTGSFNFEFTLSNLYSFISALLFGIHIFVLATLVKGSNERIISLLQILVVFILFVLYVFILEPSTFTASFSLFSWAELVYLAIFGAALAYFFQTYASKYLPANVCSIILGLESSFAVFFSIVLGLDTITIYYTIGTILVLIGTLTVIREENKAN